MSVRRRPGVDTDAPRHSCGPPAPSARLRVLFVVKASDESLKGPREALWGLRAMQSLPDLDVRPFLLTPDVLGRSKSAVAARLGRPVFPGHRVLPGLVRMLRGPATEADVVVSFNHTATAALLSMKRAKTMNARLFCLGLGLPDSIGRSGTWRRRAARWLSVADRVLAMSDGEVDYLQGLGLAVSFLPYGVDTEYWTRDGEYRRGDVFSVGSDPHRDFNTLVRASYALALTIMTRRRDVVSVPVPPTVSFVQGDTESLRKHYARAAVVVVPIKDVVQPSGQNTILQALSMGSPVVVTQTRASWTEHLRDGENCLMVRPGDQAELRRAIERLLSDPSLARRIGREGARAARQHFGIERYCAWVAELLHESVVREPAGERL